MHRTPTLARSILGAALALASAGCAPGGDLSGGAVRGVPPEPTGAALAEGRGTPTGIGGTVWLGGAGESAMDGAGSLEAVELSLWEDLERDGACEPTPDAARGTTAPAPDGSYFFAVDVPGSYCVQVGGGGVPQGWSSAMSAPVSVGTAGETLDIALP